MNEKGSNTFPFHNLPPELKKTYQRSFLLFLAFPYWIKEKSVATLAIRTITIKRKTTKSILPPRYRTGDSAGELILKSGVTLGLNHIYLLSLFDLYALHFGSLFGLLLKILHPDLRTPFR